MLTRLEIENYKSLHNVSIELPKFCAIVGANAAGKSNFADAMEFLSLAVRNGLPTALDAKGGYENICFRRTRRAKAAIRFRITSEYPVLNVVGDAELRFEYEFAFRATGQSISSEFEVVDEVLQISARGVEHGASWSPLLSCKYPARGRAEIRVFEAPGFEGLIDSEEKFRQFLGGERPAEFQRELLLTNGLGRFHPVSFLCQHLQRLRIFQVMPPGARRPASASGSGEMGKHGDNLPAAINYLRRNHKEAFESLLEHLQLAVPTVREVETGYVETRELGLFLKEEGIQRRLYASELSDGTLRSIGLFVALVDPRYSLVVIEEPENSIHPWVTKRFVAACRELSEGKQIVLTTHSPSLLAELAVDEVFIAERKEGSTALYRPTDIDSAVERILAAKVMDLGQYWESGAMRGVPEQLELFKGSDAG